MTTPIVITPPAPRFINNRPYPIGVQEPSGARRTIRPGGVIEGEWYARFVGPKSLAVWREDAQKQTKQAVETARAFGTSTIRESNRLYQNQTNEQWIAVVATATFGENMAKGELLGLASFLGVRTGDEFGKNEVIGAIKAHFGT